MIISRAKAEEAAKELLIHGFFLEGLTEQVVNEAYRSRARETHPDMEGGSGEAFARVDWAKHVMLAWISKQGEYVTIPTLGAKCLNCGGGGFIQKQLGFKKGARVQCVRCSGTGDAGYEPDKPGGEY